MTETNFMTDGSDLISLETDPVRKDLLQRIQHTLDKIRPYIQADGGDVYLVGYADGIVTVTMAGACNGCMVIDSTLNDGIKAILMDEVPEVHDVRLLETNNYNEFNPYY
ncbi:MAG: NifU family protein [Erysipelotrichaceae bacterium]|nr:NifU family protein [Erysipelotrichaceae bacterium]MDY6034681.1 NifU family protein [Bulleidia sp.]